MTHGAAANDASRRGGVTPAAILHEGKGPAVSSVTLVTLLFQNAPNSRQRMKPAMQRTGARSKPRLPTAARLSRWRHTDKRAQARSTAASPGRASQASCDGPASPSRPLRAAGCHAGKDGKAEDRGGRAGRIRSGGDATAGDKTGDETFFPGSLSKRGRDFIPAGGMRQGQRDSFL